MVNGLIYIDDFITDIEENNLLTFINLQKWSDKLSRRTQHYGYEYVYNKYNTLDKAPEIPTIFNDILNKINKKFNKTFNQLIINEYTPGQGIAPHIDNIKLFDDTIVSISLGSTYPMEFAYKDKVYTQILKQKSLVALTSDARYKYKHSISARKYDSCVLRGIRISLTFRQTIT
jgi:alkylated DNA repair dioxygenase AlkB